MLFLFANSTTVDFYPKFGFTRTDEYQYVAPVSPTPGDFRKLDMDSAQDIALLKHYYQKSNPFSQLRVENNFGLLMFYCSAFMKHFVYYSEKNQAVAIAMQSAHELICFDIFAMPDNPWRPLSMNSPSRNRNRQCWFYAEGSARASTKNRRRRYVVYLFD